MFLQPHVDSASSYHTNCFLTDVLSIPFSVHDELYCLFRMRTE